MPTEYSIAKLYPNPFNPTLTVVVGLPEPAGLCIRVYNITGRQVAELVDGRRGAGYHGFVFNGSAMASGAYFVRASIPGQLEQVRKVILIK